MVQNHVLLGRVSPYVAFQAYEEWSQPASITGIVRLSDEFACVFLEITPFYPVDDKWPDQPSDKGTFILDGHAVEIIGCFRAWFQENQDRIFFDVKKESISAKYDCTVAHIVSIKSLEFLSIGARVWPKVDAGYRRAMSRHHTASHLFSLALNQILHHVWDKDVSRDQRGYADFDRIAIESSKISEHCSIETYRIGKSLRKKGFKPTRLPLTSTMETDICNILDEWLLDRHAITVTPSRGPLSEKRVWSCSLGGTSITMPCGGTHLTNTAELGRVSCGIQYKDETLKCILRSVGV
ncbi:hypothetical protein LWC05_08195 [Acetobacter sicerae]|uniref:Alanyl-tRNA synthetase n=1 Tax=Acetobacter sicerae TaxID=85325 RepID=A0ABS8VY72_9PROT|nr:MULTISPECIES: hypothetical protein [Acetobacter]MBC9009766.1 hypothetical protein [Acetobacter tropicalis]MCE0743872.1 hypothetical protein [Acetobacter sicerae]